MSIEKMPKNLLKHEQSPFTTIFNEALQGITNMEALGVYCYLASKPHDWIINKKELESHFNCGRKKVNSAFEHLKSIGALEIVSIRDSKGRIQRWETILKRQISRIPLFDNVEKSQCGKSTPTNKRNIQIKEDTNNIYNTRDDSGKIIPNEYQESIYDKNFKQNELSTNTLHFETFWSLYPKPKNKPRSQALWSDGNLDLNANEIITKLKQQIEKDSEWLDGYAPSICNYISQKRWLDGIVIKPKTQKSTKQPLNHDSTDWAKMEGRLF